MNERSGQREVTRPDQKQLLLLRGASSLLTHCEVKILARTQSDLSADELRGELDAIGPLRDIPHLAWEQYAEQVELLSVADGHPRGRETVLPLWTEDGPAARAVRVRLYPHKRAKNYWICGFVDVEPGQWLEVPADPIVPPGPLEILPSRGENPVPERWRPVVSQIVHRLVVEDYAGLQRDGIVHDIDDPEKDLVKKWIEEYHDPLVDLPENAWEWSDCIPAFDGPGAYSVELSMWTAHQGLSSLTMEANVDDQGGDDIRVEIFSVHVM